MWRAWPAAVETRTAGGWWLRATPGVERRRSNCAAAVDPSRADLDAIPADLVQVRLDDQVDRALAARGWTAESTTEVLAAPPPPGPPGPPGGGAVRVAGRAEWARAWGALSARGDVAATEREVLARLGDRARYLLVDAVAAALVVVDPPWAGVYCMVVDPAHRRRGHARALLAAAAEVAGAGAPRRYLQVERDNVAARALYAGAGFVAVPELAYRYRRRTTSATAASGARFST